MKAFEEKATLPEEKIHAIICNNNSSDYSTIRFL